MPSIIRATTTSGLQVAPDNSGSLQLQTNGTTTAVTIDTSQNVGIGTTSPAAKLVSAGSSSTVYKALILRNGDGTTGSSATIDFEASAGTQGDEASMAGRVSGIRTGSGTSGALAFSTTNGGTLAERMRIDSVGRPLINTTSALNAGYMSMLFDGQTYNGFTLKTSYATTGSVYLYFINSAGNVAGFVSQNGTTTVSYTTSSDYRLKENIVPMTGALDKVLQLKPVNYTWKQDGLDGQGFIAHELQAVVPDAVVGEKDAVDAEGNPKYQGVDTSFLVATLTAAIQEQQTIINDLKARIETLEAK
jgi:hypothetical protein